MNEYDTSWDLTESEEGNTPLNKDSFDRIYEEWQQRSWESWLSDNLTFPFLVKRVEDDDDAYFTDFAGVCKIDGKAKMGLRLLGGIKGIRSNSWA